METMRDSLCCAPRCGLAGHSMARRCGLPGHTVACRFHANRTERERRRGAARAASDTRRLFTRVCSCEPAWGASVVAVYATKHVDSMHSVGSKNRAIVRAGATRGQPVSRSVHLPRARAPSSLPRVSLSIDSQVTALGDGRFAGIIASGWDILGNANGGYLLYMATRALGQAVGTDGPARHPVTVSSHYLSPGKPGPVEIATQVLKRGRTMTTATATLSDARRPLMHVTATFGSMRAADAGPEPLFMDGQTPTLPPPKECVLLRPNPPFPPPFTGQIEIRLHPIDHGFVTGQPSGQAVMRAWIGLNDSQQNDALSCLLASDSLPPTVFNAKLPFAWVPTLSLSVHQRALPGPGYLASRTFTRYVTGGFLEIDGELWTEDGTLLAQSRQLALAPRPGR